MAATFDASLSTDRDVMRLTVGDMDITAPYLQDETYDALLVRNTSLVTATLAVFDTLMAMMAVPDIYADWYREFNHKEAYDRLKQRREDYANANGASRFTSRAVSTYRADSNMTEGIGE